MDSGSEIPHLTTFRKENVIVLLASQPSKSSYIIPHFDLVQAIIEDVELNKLINEIPLRRSQRVCKLVISNDYMVYSYEHEFNVIDETNSITFP